MHLLTNIPAPPKISNRDLVNRDLILLYPNYKKTRGFTPPVP